MKTEQLRDYALLMLGAPVLKISEATYAAVTTMAEKLMVSALTPTERQEQIVWKMQRQIKVVDHTIRLKDELQ
jgi:hypothetical protein